MFLRGELANSLHAQVFKSERLPKNYRAQNAQFARRIPSINIGGGVRFGIAQCLRLSKRVCIRHAPFHLGQDVIGCAVQDASHRLDLETA
jgi:hypothetical protein